MGPRFDEVIETAESVVREDTRGTGSDVRAPTRGRPRHGAVCRESAPDRTNRGRPASRRPSAVRNRSAPAPPVRRGWSGGADAGARCDVRRTVLGHRLSHGARTGNGRTKSSTPMSSSSVIGSSGPTSRRDDSDTFPVAGVHCRSTTTRTRTVLPARSGGAERPGRPGPMQVEGHCLDNGLLRVRLQPDGTLDLERPSNRSEVHRPERSREHRGRRRRVRLFPGREQFDGGRRSGREPARSASNRLVAGLPRSSPGSASRCRSRSRPIVDPATRERWTARSRSG